MWKLKHKRSLSIMMIFLLAIQLLPVREFSFAVGSGESVASVPAAPVSTTSGGAIVIDTVEINLTHEETLTGTVENKDPGTGVLIPGEDETTADKFVRTLDTVTYDLSYSVKEQSKQGQNVVLKGYLTEPAGQEKSAEWSESLTAYSGLTISSDGKTFTYAIGDLDGGEAYKFSATAHVPTTSNGNTFEAHFEITGDNTNTVTTTPVESVVSAIPKVDLVLVKYSDENKVNSDDTIDIISQYGIALVSRAEMGMESIKQPVTFEVDIENIGIDEVRLKSSDGFGINGEGATIYSLPYGKIKTGKEEKSVSNSGSVSMTQSAPGENIQVTINGMDTSLNHFPTQNIGDGALAVSGKFFFAGYLKLVIDNDNLVDGKNPVTLTYKDLVVEGTSGQSNYGSDTEPLENNTHTHSLEKRKMGDGSFGFRVDYVKNIHSTTKLDTMTSSTSGDGTVVAGQVFGATAYIRNSDFRSLSNMAMLLKIDPDVLELTDYINGSSTPIKTKAFGDLGAGNVKISYGVKTFSDYDDMRNTTDSPGGVWYDSVEEAESATGGQVSLIKVEAANGAQAGYHETMTLCLSLRAKTNPVGTILPIFASGYADEVNGGVWDIGNYEPLTNNGGSKGQRLFLSEVLSRIEKKDITVGANISTNSGVETSTYTLDGDQIVNFQLQPSLTGDLRAGQVDVSKDVLIQDVLPEGMFYVDGSASLDPQSVDVLSDNTTKIIWNLGKVKLNKTLDPITYSVKIPSNTKKNTVLTNTVVISSQADLSGESLRTDTYPILVLNTRAWSIKEEVITPKVEINEPIKYQIQYSNLDDKNMTNFDLITVLPAVNDGTNLTEYKGEYEVKAVQVHNGETVLATTEPADQIEIDPNVLWPKWSVYEDMSADEKKQITGLRFKSPLYEKTEGTRTIDIELLPKNNEAGDVYGTFTSGRTEEIDQLIRSQNVSAQVVSSSLGDTVWYDENLNGQKDSGENGIKDVTVKLMQNGSEVASTVTDESGEYTFNNLHSGTYSIVIDTSTLPTDVTQVYDPDTNSNHETTVLLGVDENHVTADFGYKEKEVPVVEPKGEIGDYIFKDVDKDGTQSAGDTGIENVTVTLVNTDTNAQKTTKTDSNGLYKFSGLEAGNYKVRVDANTLSDTLEISVDPDSTKDGVYSITLAKDQVINSADFGYKEKEVPVVEPKGEIGDYIFKDLDKDGTQSAGDTGIENVTVTLVNTDTSAQKTTKTDSNGLYKFSGLEAGNYKVTVDASTLSDTLEISVDPDSTKDGVYSITLAKDQVINSADFGYKEKEVPVVEPKGEIGDYIFKDVDKDGTQSAGDTGIENVTVTLVNTDTNAQKTTKTDSNGLYKFSGLEAGNYQVRVDASTLSDTLEISVDPDSTKDGVYSITLAKDQVINSADFGYKEKEVPVVVPKGEIGDYIFKDVDKDGTQSAGDTGIENVTVTLVNTDTNAQITTKTDSNGLYKFSGLEAGNYQVRVDANTLSDTLEISVDPDSTKDGVYSITLAKDQVINSADFGYKEKEVPVVEPKGEIGDYVFLDVNNNGVEDAGDKPLANVTVELVRPDNTTVQTKTDESGLYKFEGLEAGKYSVKVFASSLSVDHKLTIDPDAIKDGVHIVQLEKDQVVKTVDFGFVIQSTDNGGDNGGNNGGNNGGDSGDNNSGGSSSSNRDDKKKNKDKNDDKPQNKDVTTGDVITDETIEEMIKNGRLKVYHVDKLTNELLTDVSSKTAPVGAEYATSSKTFNDYMLVDVPTNKAGLINEDETVVTYNYEKVITIEDGDVPLGMTVLPKTGEESKTPYILLGLLLIILGVSVILYRSRDEKCETDV